MYTIHYNLRSSKLNKYKQPEKIIFTNINLYFFLSFTSYLLFVNIIFCNVNMLINIYL